MHATSQAEDRDDAVWKDDHMGAQAKESQAHLNHVQILVDLDNIGHKSACLKRDTDDDVINHSEAVFILQRSPENA